jgi:hypothetical protein
MAFCSNCGGKLDEGVRFCTGCGTAAGGSVLAARQPEMPPVPPNNTSAQIVKQGEFCCKYGGIKKEKGSLTLYTDRLEWKGERGNSAVISIEKITAVEIKVWLTVTEKLIVRQATAEYVFEKPITAASVGEALLIGGVASTVIVKKELEAWKTAIIALQGQV